MIPLRKKKKKFNGLDGVSDIQVRLQIVASLKIKITRTKKNS